MGKTKAIHLVSHTHWDREWYLPFEMFRFRLVGLIDRLLDTMVRQPEYRFHLDGQTIVLEDYLELRPERRDELKRLVSEGRLSIGPWYVLMDEFLVSGEAIVRNLEEGRRSGAAFGPLLRAGYLPDTFGHISQMPQLLRRFGIDRAVVWRGLNGTPEDTPTEFDWEAPSGDRVATAHLPYQYGYTSAMSLPEDLAAAAARLRELLGDIAPYARSGQVLLMNGFDHMEPQPHIPALIDWWNAHENTRLMHSTMADYLEAALGSGAEEAPGVELEKAMPGVGLEKAESGVELVKAEVGVGAGGAAVGSEASVAGGAEAVPGVGQTGATSHKRPSESERPVIAGALRHTNHQPGGAINTILPHVLSSRVYLKQQNARAQALMEKAAEPLEALALTLGGVHHPAFVRQAWRYILQNHPHDSICGCSIDAVHDEMETRFAKAGQIGEQLIVEALARLSGSVDRSRLPEGGASALVFNALPWRRDALVEIALDADDDTVYRSALLEDTAGWSCEAEIVDIERVCPIETDSARYPLGKAEVVRHTVRVLLRELPAYGHRLLSARLRRQPILSGLPVRPASDTIDNGLISVKAEPDGTLTWTDLVTGEVRTGLHRFEDCGDVGDEYSYSPPVLNACMTGGTVRSISVRGEGRDWRTLTVRYELAVPRAASGDTRRRDAELTTLDIMTELTLLDGSRTIMCRTTVNNTALDHRLRLLFPVQGKIGPVRAGAAYDTMAWPEQAVQPPEDVWVENEPTCYPFHGYIWADGAQSRMVLTAEGLHEYEWVPATAEGSDGTLAITLLRSVSHLGGADRGMSTTNRPGPGLAAFGGQVQRTLTFAYGLTVGSGNEVEAPWRLADELAAPPLCRVEAADASRPDAALTGAAWSDGSGTPLPAERSWLEIDEPALCVTALRPAPDDGDGIELRFVNLADEPRAGAVTVRLPLETATETGLDGSPLAALQPERLPEGGLRLPVTLGAKEIRTIRLR